MNMIKAKTTSRAEQKEIVWGGDDPFTHTLIVGPTRCGKTSKILQPLIYQALLKMRNGEKLGISVIEPKGDVARMVRDMAIEMGLAEKLVYIDPLYPEETNKINVMKGDKNDVAEATVAVLKSLFGKQDAFFATVQELSSRKVTLLLKELKGDNMDIMDVLENLRDPVLLKMNVDTLRSKTGNNDLIAFFDNELLGTGNMADKYRQFIVGLRAQLENITSNEHLRAIVTGKSDIDLDEHFEKGGILAINTALGKLGKSGDAFGMFISMHLQLATFRRPGEERTRVPHYLIFDEYSRYINPDVERFLSIAASYRVALIAAIQSLGQLEIESGMTSAKAMKRAILTSTRNKIIFGGLEYEDAEEVSRIMGKDLIKERKKKYDGGILQNVLPKMYEDTEEEKERFYSTFMMDGLPKFHFVAKLLLDGTPQEPIVGVADFIPRDWKERLQDEEQLRRPSILDWEGWIYYRVKKRRIKELAEKRERAKEIFLNDPFDLAVEIPSSNSNPSIDLDTELAEEKVTPAKFVFHIGPREEHEPSEEESLMSALPKEEEETELVKPPAELPVKEHQDQKEETEFFTIGKKSKNKPMNDHLDEPKKVEIKPKEEKIIVEDEPVKKEDYGEVEDNVFW